MYIHKLSLATIDKVEGSLRGLTLIIHAQQPLRETLRCDFLCQLRTIHKDR